MIEGLKLIKLKVIQGEEGDVLHCLAPQYKISFKLENGNNYVNDNNICAGEVYFSESQKWLPKGWKIHYKQDQLLTCPYGDVCFYLKDLREDSPTAGCSCHYEIGKNTNYSLLRIPKGVMYTFFSITKETSLVVNLPSCPHSKEDNTKYQMFCNYTYDLSVECKNLISQLKLKYGE